MTGKGSESDALKMYKRNREEKTPWFWEAQGESVILFSLAKCVNRLLLGVESAANWKNKPPIVDKTVKPSPGPASLEQKET